MQGIFLLGGEGVECTSVFLCFQASRKVNNIERNLPNRLLSSQKLNLDGIATGKGERKKRVWLEVIVVLPYLSIALELERLGRNLQRCHEYLDQFIKLSGDPLGNSRIAHDGWSIIKLCPYIKIGLCVIRAG